MMPFQPHTSALYCRDIREAFIRAKYENKAWIPRIGDDKETLSKALCVSVSGGNTKRTYELICSGAKVSDRIDTLDQLFGLSSTFTTACDCCVGGLRAPEP